MSIQFTLARLSGCEYADVYIFKIRKGNSIPVLIDY